MISQARATALRHQFGAFVGTLYLRGSGEFILTCSQDNLAYLDEIKEYRRIFNEVWENDQEVRRLIDEREKRQADGRWKNDVS